MSTKLTKKGLPYKKRGRKPKITQSRVVYGFTGKPTKAFNFAVGKIVKEKLNKELEAKYAQALVFNQQTTVGYGLNNTSSLGLTSTQSIIPTLALGDDVGSRDGNKVRTKSFHLKYCLRALPTTYLGGNDNPFVPFLVRVIVYNKKISLTDNNNLGILQQGASNTQFGSAPETWLEPYNKDVFNILYSKEYLMVAPRRATNTATPNQWAQDAVIEGAKSFVNKKVKITIPKTLIFDDAANSNRPQNIAAFMAVCVCNVDGSTPGATTDTRLMVNAETQLWYTDA